MLPEWKRFYVVSGDRDDRTYAIHSYSLEGADDLLVGTGAFASSSPQSFAVHTKDGLITWSVDNRQFSASLIGPPGLRDLTMLAEGAGISRNATRFIVRDEAGGIHLFLRRFGLYSMALDGSSDPFKVLESATLTPIAVAGSGPFQRLLLRGAALSEPRNVFPIYSTQLGESSGMTLIGNQVGRWQVVLSTVEKVAFSNEERRLVLADLAGEGPPEYVSGPLPLGGLTHQVLVSPSGEHFSKKGPSASRPRQAQTKQGD